MANSMRHVLIGNGVIIQHGGEDYLNSSIVNRAIAKIRSGNFPSHLYPKECADFVVMLAHELAPVLAGQYDALAVTTYDSSALESLKQRYSLERTYAPSEIGFEDSRHNALICGTRSNTDTEC